MGHEGSQLTSFWCFFCYISSYFTPFSSAYILNKLILAGVTQPKLKVPKQSCNDLPIIRSSHQRCSVKKGVLKKETLAQLFSCEYCEISKNTFFTEHPKETISASCRNQSNDMICYANQL